MNDNQRQMNAISRSNDVVHCAVPLGPHEKIYREQLLLHNGVLLNMKQLTYLRTENCSNQM